MQTGSGNVVQVKVKPMTAKGIGIQHGTGNVISVALTALTGSGCNINVAQGIVPKVAVTPITATIKPVGNLVYQGRTLSELPYSSWKYEYPREAQYTFYIAAKDRSGNWTDPQSITLYHPGIEQLAAPTVNEYFEVLEIVMPPVYDIYELLTGAAKVTPELKDITGYKIYIQEVDSGNSPIGSEQVFTHTDESLLIWEAEAGSRWRIKIGAFDSVVNEEHNPALYEATISDPVYAETAKLTTPDFGDDIRPIEIVNTLPTLPDADYPAGAVVFLTTDNKLYRSTGTAWTAAVPAGDITGRITETQISSDAISTPKLQANVVTAAKIAANAVIADKIMAGAVTAAKLAATIAYAGTLVIKGADDLERAGMTYLDSGVNAIRIWAGDTLANRAVAPFRVTQGGKFVSTDAEIRGKFEVYDDTNLVGSLHKDTHGGQLHLYDLGGEAVASMGAASGTGPNRDGVMQIFNAAGGLRASMSITADSGRIHAVDPNDKISASMAAATTAAGAYLYLHDTANSIAFQLKAGDDSFIRYGSLDIRSVLKLTELPTSDPEVAGQVWNSGGTVKVSTGSS